MAIWKDREGVRDRPAALLFGPAKRAMTSCNIGPLLTLPFGQIVIVLGYTYISSTAASVSPHCATFSRTF